MPETLLRTKLFSPPPRPDLVSRPRLIERLNQGLERGCRLSLVSAPAGFGKTTLIVEWGMQIAESDALRLPQLCWVSLDQKDDDPVRFLALVVAAFKTADEALGQSAQAMLQVSPAPPESVLTAVINDVAASPRQFIVVLDDYHLISAQDIHEALDFLLENSPSNLHLTITSRADPPLQLARWRARGQMTEIRQADLSFTAAETGDFLARQSGFSLTAEQSTLLAERTEGWIAGLQLAALALQAHLVSSRADNADSFLNAFAGDDRYVLDYLSDEVLGGQPAEVQTFLLRTSILNRLTGPLADAVTGGDDSQQLLERLEQANLFLFPLDNRRQWFRYHQLFADMLQSRLLRRSSRQELAGLHHRAAAWYEQNGLASEAIEHALAANDVDLAAALVIQIADDLMYHTGEVASLRRWLAALPGDQIRSRPQLLLIQAWMHLWSTKPDAAETSLSTLPPGPLPAEFRGQEAVLRAQIAAQRGDAQEAMAQAKEALSHLPSTSHRLRGLALAALGTAYRNLGQVQLATGVFEDSTAEFQAADLLIPTLLTLTNQGSLQFSLGRLHRADAVFQQALQLAANRLVLKLPAVGGIHIALAELLYEWNKLDQAAEHLKRGIELCHAWPGFAEEMLAGLLCLAYVTQAKGDVQETADLVHQAEQLVQTYGLSHWSAQLDLHRAKLWLGQGNVSEAAGWAAKQNDSETEMPIILLEQTQITLAHLHLLQGRPAETLVRIDALLPSAEAEGRIGSLLSMLLLQALAHYQQRQIDQALMTLSRVLTLSEPGGHIRLFLDHGPPLAALLQQALLQGITPEYTSSLLAAFEAENQAGQGQETTTSPGSVSHVLVEPLTGREREVLQLISAGLSNPEIAQELVIAVTTVKTHVQNIYGKLNVSNRYQAIEKARELNLI